MYIMQIILHNKQENLLCNYGTHLLSNAPTTKAVRYDGMGTFCLKLKTHREESEECDSLPNLSAPIKATRSHGTVIYNEFSMVNFNLYNMVIKCNWTRACICPIYYTLNVTLLNENHYTLYQYPQPCQVYTARYVYMGSCASSKHWLNPYLGRESTFHRGCILTWHHLTCMNSLHIIEV